MTDRLRTLVHDCLIHEAGGTIVAEPRTGYVTIENMEADAVFIVAPGSHLENLFIAPRYPGWTWFRVPRIGRFRRFWLRLAGFRYRHVGLRSWRT